MNLVSLMHLRPEKIMEKLYRVETLCTDGWSLVDEKYVRMTKDQTKQVLEGLIAEGYNPNTLRAIPDHSVQ